MKVEKAILMLFAGMWLGVAPLAGQDSNVVVQVPDAGAVRSAVVVAGGVKPFFFATFGDQGFGPGDEKTVAGAPFSAKEVTDSDQTLSDGNQIKRSSTEQIYRDSAGRVRREITISTVGPWKVSGQPKQIIVITDPVNQVRYFIRPAEKMAYKLPLNPPGQKFVFRAMGGREKAQVAFKDAGGRDKAQDQTQSLGVKIIQGLEVQGTQVTDTIPAGAIGNQEPIVSTTEKWYSPDLQTYVVVNHTDPRFGTTTFQLENISRNEPAAALFQVPAGYKVQDAPVKNGPAGGGVSVRVQSPD
jgi:hypothetical protein